MNQHTAQLKYLRMAPRKVRLVANMLNGLRVDEAEAQLLLMPRRAAKPLLKLLRSAIANAKNNRQVPKDRLVVKSMRVDQGPMLERFLPRARGSASPIQKKMSHVFLVLDEVAVSGTRFSITLDKKTKRGPDGKRRAKPAISATKPEEGGSASKQQNTKGLRRFFSRKSV